MGDDEDDDYLEKLEGRCTGCDQYGPAIPVMCLGCMENFMRCVKCYHTATCCSEACREQHRKKIASIFAPGAPKIGGIGDIRL